MTDAERQILVNRLAEAEAAYHTMMLGNKASVVVDSNGERIEFGKSESYKLSSYIAELKRQLTPYDCTGPLKVIF